MDFGLHSASNIKSSLGNAAEVNCSAMMGEPDINQKHKQRQHTRQEDESDSPRVEELNSEDEKKESEHRSSCGDLMTMWPTSTTIVDSNNDNVTVLSDCHGDENSPSKITLYFADNPLQTQTMDLQGIDTTRVPSANGLHHRAHAANQTGAVHTASVQSSPNRRRRARTAVGKAFESQFRKKNQKWTVMLVCRTLLLAGGFMYFVVMIRGTQILMQQEQQDVNEDSDFSNTGEPHVSAHSLSDLIALPYSAGYLRGAFLIENLGPPFVQTPLREGPLVIKEMVDRRLNDRRSRTRPPLQRYQTNTMMKPYEIVTTDRRPIEKVWQPGVAQLPANATQLCGAQTQLARDTNPGFFLRDDALRNSNAKVLITGIVSNPLAFHLALTLKAQCGVEVLIGVDPMLPNTIRNRLRFVEQLKILSSKVPNMLQPPLVPLLGLDPRVKKAKKGESSPDQPLTLEMTGEINLLSFQPTHIVHLSTAMYQNPTSSDIEPSPFAPKQPLSPYQLSEDDVYEPSLFHIRTSLTAMEQILASVVSSTSKGEYAPHVTYASATMNKAFKFSSDDKVLFFSKQADEVMADTYHFLFGTRSMGVRIPPKAVYGPWSPQGSDMYKLLDETTFGNFSSFEKHAVEQEFIYVQDAVDAIITAMQYRSNEAATVELSGDSVSSLSKVASMAQLLLKEKPTAVPPGSLPARATNSLQWKPRTSLRDGILRALAWHLDKNNPYGPPPETPDQRIASSAESTPRTGDALLQKHSAATCSADDLACHVGGEFLPCASECSIKVQCRSSIFDSVRELTREMTEGCDAVLYTQSLGRNIEDLQLQSQFEDDVEPAICNLAFVARESPLVSAVIDKIPAAELARLGVPARVPEDKKRSLLNGRLLYRGWILIWVDPPDSVSAADSALMKLSPGRMFAKDVMYAVFVEENFTVSPTMDDVRFLISQMDRGATKQRNVYRMVKKDEHSPPEKVKLIVPEQPEKRAAILVSQLKYKISERGRISQDAKISVLDAVRFMRFEVGSDPTQQKESSAIRLQKEFYRRIPTFVNAKDLRDNDEPLYRYEMKHWVRTRWVVHDLTLEESRELRCDWYQEHVQWGSEIDQLSFAAIMAKRIIDRRMTQKEPDDRAKSKSADIAEIRDLTDNNEWFPMHKLDDEDGGIQQANEDQAEDELAEDGQDVSADLLYSPKKKSGVGLYVRVISDRIMSLSRKAWARYRAEMMQASKQNLGAQ